MRKERLLRRCVCPVSYWNISNERLWLLTLVWVNFWTSEAGRVMSNLDKLLIRTVSCVYSSDLY